MSPAATPSFAVPVCLHARLREALASASLEDKPALAIRLAEDYAAGKVALDACPAPGEPTLRGVPPRPMLVLPQKVPRRNPGSPEGRAALLHAIVHIEWSAIDLALDHALRFPGLPAAYYADWVNVAAEEAVHFRLLRGHLQTLGYDYGDFPAHDSLWQMAVRTGHDPLARMALVPRFFEARGLDATPPIQARLKQAGDTAGADLLDIILRDEVGHVGLGDRWFRHLCEAQGGAPEPTYRQLLETYRAPRPVPPINRDARLSAGFSEAELALLCPDLS